jgi:hypothetical protein
LALELAGGTAPARQALPAAQAGELAERVGRDLAKLVPRAARAGPGLRRRPFRPGRSAAPGLADPPAPGRTAARAPGRDQGPRLLAFGADADGEVPLPFQADPAWWAAACAWCRSC